MEINRLKKLIRKYHSGQCSTEEWQELQQLLADSKQESLLESIYDLLPEDMDTPISSERQTHGLRHLWEDPRVQAAKQRKENRKLRIPYYAVAVAVLLIIAGFGGWRFLTRYYPADKVMDQIAVVPGQDKAQIVLDDGRTFHLDSLSDTDALRRKGFYLSRQEGKQMLFKYNPDAALNRSGFHTLSTPKGGQFQLELPDGTKIWMNAESTLRFSSNFADKERYITCEGEVYFEVAKRMVNGKAMPFKVSTKGQQLEVLGTSFNLNSYGDKVITTLLEGKVSLKDELSNPIFLAPNQQAVYQQGFKVQEVDPMYAVAWKDGDFAFQKAKIEEVMRDIARWYNVEVEFLGNFDRDVFSGTISKYENIDRLLKTMELTGSFHFIREGRKITVKK